MKVYLDNNVVSALGKNDTPAESAAIKGILEAFDAGKCDLYTSKVTGDEIDKYQGSGRFFVESIYRLLKKVPFVDSQKLLGFSSFGNSRSRITSPMFEDDPIWSKLRSIGIDKQDAHHLMLAVRAGCTIFLTCDSGLLNKASEIQREFAIQVMKPSDLIVQINQI